MDTHKKSFNLTQKQCLGIVMNMVSKDVIMVIDKPNFIVRLHSTFLEVDLKEGARKELEDVLEANPSIRGNLGFFFQNIIPLDVSLRDVKTVKQGEKGQVKIAIPHRKDIIIPLEPDEAKELVSKLNELIPLEQQKKAERLLATQEAEKEVSRQRARVRRH